MEVSPRTDGDKASQPTAGDMLASEIHDRLMAHVANGTTDGSDGAVFNDVSAYTSPDWLAAEKDRLFRSLPLLACLSSDLPEPGDRVVFDEAGPSILIVRDADRRIGAYLNVCPHRAARLVADCNRSSRISCPFHSWTFDLTGRLVGLPRPWAFDNLNREELRLARVPVIEWEGLVFVIPRAGRDEIDIAGHLGALATEIAALGLDHATLAKRTRLKASANWKYVLDTFGEGYHVRTLHPDTVGRFVVSDTVIYDGIGRHHRMSFANRSMAESVNHPGKSWTEADLRVIYFLFPNTLIQSTPLGSGRNHIIYRIFPGAEPGKSSTMLESYRSAPPGDADIEPWIDAHDFQVSVVGGEDYPMAESAQRGMENGAPNNRIAYGRNEISLQRFHRHVAELIGRPF